MKFMMNDRSWEIIELTQEEIRKHFREYKYDGDPVQGKYYGLTYFDEQKIYIDKNMHYQQKIQTLSHELMHCYIGCYLFQKSDDYTEEDLCNISANSHKIIHNIIERYFQKGNL